MQKMSNEPNIESVSNKKNRFKRLSQNFIVEERNDNKIKSGNGLDPNVYATKKTISQGMLDVALLTANASQLKYCLQLGKKHDFYYLLVTLITTSIVMQLLVGGLFVFIGYINFNNEKRQQLLNYMNNISTVGVFVITVVNILIAGFGLNTVGTVD